MDVFHYQIALSKRVNLGYFFHLYYLVGKTYHVVTIHKNRCFFYFSPLHLIVQQNCCSKRTTEDFGYVKVHKIVLLLVRVMLSYNFFLGLVVIWQHYNSPPVASCELLETFNPSLKIDRHNYGAPKRFLMLTKKNNTNFLK